MEIKSVESLFDEKKQEQVRRMASTPGLLWNIEWCFRYKVIPGNLRGEKDVISRFLRKAFNKVISRGAGVVWLFCY